jgi:hypothetical protein
MKLTRREFLKVGATGGVALPIVSTSGCVDGFDEVVIFSVVGSMLADRESSILDLFPPDEVRVRTDFPGLEGIPFIYEIHGFRSEDLEFLVNHNLVTRSVDQITVHPGDLVSWGEFWEEIPEGQSIIESEDGVSQATFALRRRRRRRDC